MKKSFFIVLLSFVGILLHSQTEADLKLALEGQRVEILIEMPATKEGIDLQMNKPQKIDFDIYSDRIKEHGIALYPGDIVLITKIKKKSKHIEFQLAGGGFGTFGDESGHVSPISISKTSRQKELEKMLDKDKKKELENRKELEKELKDLQRERQMDQDQANREAAMQSELKKSRLQSQKLQAGSRFNIRYDYKIGSNELSLKSIKNALDGYVEFNLSEDEEILFTDTEDQAKPGSLQKGMELDEVVSFLGIPKSIITSNECGFEKTVCEFDQNDQQINAIFIEKILVKYTLSSK